MQIQSYFAGSQAPQTLDAGFAYASKLNWSAADRTHLYLLADKAFGTAPNYSDFAKLYSALVSYWRIGRGGGLATAAEAYDALSAGCASASRHSGITLLSPDDIRRHTTLLAIRAMAGVKHNREYPHMAAAKFLHFYNPSLFPIYDEAIIWKEILNGKFRTEWGGICAKYRIKVWEGSERFLTTYYDWASYVVRNASTTLMSDFECRYKAASGPVNVGNLDIGSYYAAALEYGLLGARYLT